MTSTCLQPTLAEPIGRYLRTRSGQCLRLRPASVSDGRLLAEFFAGLSSEDLRFRFLHARKRPAPAEIATLLNVDHRRSEHLLAFDTATGKLAASLMILADESLKTAEVAIAVAEEFRARGVGWTLLKHAADLARERGLKRLSSVEDIANYDALAVEHALGFRSRALNSVPGLVLVEADLG